MELQHACAPNLPSNPCWLKPSCSCPHPAAGVQITMADLEPPGSQLRACHVTSSTLRQSRWPLQAWLYTPESRGFAAELKGKHLGPPSSEPGILACSCSPTTCRSTCAGCCG